jgi:hypothetical protein
MDLSKYTGSVLYNADKIPLGVKFEEIVAGFEKREFDDGEKAVMLFESGMGVVLNPTRALVMTQGFGRESDNMIGQAILVSRGMTTYGGKPVSCVVIEAVNPVRIATQPQTKPALELPRRGKIDIRSGEGAWDDPPSPPEEYPEGYGGSDDDPEAA